MEIIVPTSTIPSYDGLQTENEGFPKIIPYHLGDMGLPIGGLCITDAQVNFSKYRLSFV